MSPSPITGSFDPYRLGSLSLPACWKISEMEDVWVSSMRNVIGLSGNLGLRTGNDR